MSSTRAQQSSVGDVFTENLGAGAAVGAAAYVVSYVVTFVFVVIDDVQTFGQMEVWELVGWVFYSAHFVDIEATAEGVSESGSFNLFADLGPDAALTSTVPEFVYYLVPIVVLVAAGYVVVQRAGTPDVGTEAAAGLGATVVGGYVVLGIVGVVLFETSYSILGTSVSGSPELVTSVILLGLVYPIVFGAVGGVLGSNQ